MSAFNRCKDCGSIERLTPLYVVLAWALWLLRGIALDLAYLRAHPVEVTLNQPVRYLREGQLPPATSESSWTYSAEIEEALTSRKGKRGGR